MKFTAIPAAAALLAFPLAAQAQQAPSTAAQVAPAASADLAVGTTVYGSDQNPIGTVDQITANGAIVNTGAHEIPLPANAFGSSANGPTLNITKAELDAKFADQIAMQESQLDSALVAGAEVKTSDAQPLGTIKSVEGGNVVLDREAGPLALPKELFAVDANGAPMVRASMAQIEAAMSGG